MGMRKPRILKDGAVYHVTARANRKEMILERGAMKSLFLKVIVRARKRYDFRLENYCIMGNHVHLMIRPGPGTNLSRLMQWILSVFATAFNRRCGFSGHVWGERFFSRIVEGLRAFLEVFRYIDSNPVAGGLVDDPRDWPYGGLGRHRMGACDLQEPQRVLIGLLLPEHATLSLPVPGI